MVHVATPSQLPDNRALGPSCRPRESRGGVRRETGRGVELPHVALEGMSLAIELIVERAPERIRCDGLALEERLGRLRAPRRRGEGSEDDAHVAPAAIRVDRR